MERQTGNIIKDVIDQAKSWALVAILILVLVGIGTNIGRVLVNASSNYQVYLSEKEGLDELVAEYGQLEKELLYYRSYDYKKLYARDQLNIVEPGQKLYKVTDPTEFYEVVDRRREIVKTSEYWDWWITILMPGLQ